MVNNAAAAWQAGLAALESADDGEPQATAVESLAASDYELQIV